ncbi:MAG: 50S ribosomal protein L25 [Bacillota bacterium]|nr:50S ribosomal protein L25 [Bacillota bacterium]
MERPVLHAQPRQAGHPNRERRQGRLPAVVYGEGESQPISLDRREFEELMGQGGAHGLLDLELEGSLAPTMVAEVQRHPVSGRLLHVDLHRVALDRPVRAEVPIVITGEEELVKRHGIVERLLRAVEVEALPSALPEEVAVDVGGLEPGTTLTAGELRLPEGVRRITPAEEPVLSITLPQAEETGSEESGAEAGKTEEKGAAGGEGGE